MKQSDILDSLRQLADSVMTPSKNNDILVKHIKSARKCAVCGKTYGDFPQVLSPNKSHFVEEELRIRSHAVRHLIAGDNAVVDNGE